MPSGLAGFGLLDMGFSGDDESAAGADSVLTVGGYLLASDGFFEAGVDQLVDDLIDIHPAPHKFFGDQNRRGGLGGEHVLGGQLRVAQVGARQLQPGHFQRQPGFGGEQFRQLFRIFTAHSRACSYALSTVSMVCGCSLA